METLPSLVKTDQTTTSQGWALFTGTTHPGGNTSFKKLSINSVGEDAFWSFYRSELPHISQDLSSLPVSFFFLKYPYTPSLSPSRPAGYWEFTINTKCADPVWRNLIVHAFQGQSSRSFGHSNLEKGDKVVGVSIFAESTNSAVRIWHERGGSTAVEKLSKCLRPHFPSIGIEKEQYTALKSIGEGKESSDMKMFMIPEDNVPLNMSIDFTLEEEKENEENQCTSSHSPPPKIAKLPPKWRSTSCLEDLLTPRSQSPTSILASQINSFHVASPPSAQPISVRRSLTQSLEMVEGMDLDIYGASPPTNSKPHPLLRSTSSPEKLMDLGNMAISPSSKQTTYSSPFSAPLIERHSPYKAPRAKLSRSMSSLDTVFGTGGKRKKLSRKSLYKDICSGGRAPRPLLKYNSTGNIPEDAAHFLGRKKEGRQYRKNCALPCILGSHPDLNCITPSTLCDLMNGEYGEKIDEVVIIDARYSYEYAGGHIKGARNITDPKELEARFISNPPPQGKKVAIVFHCEFSSKRGPEGYRFLRGLDRSVNLHNYPHIYYDNIYLLEGGYKRFFEECPEYCNPRSYVPMREKEFRKECRKEMQRQKRNKRYSYLACLHRSE